ncbi:MAG: hypothetical protein FWC40_01640 [Proteobacteria bacterium]|nr:hypothetical protein [Pseudomonadota bacterium]
MHRAILNAACAILLLIIQSNVVFAFGPAFEPQHAVIAAVYAAIYAVPMMPATISILIVAMLYDQSASGPPGLYALVIMAVFLIIRWMNTRFRAQHIVLIIFYAILACCMAFVAMVAGYALYYPDSMIPELAMREGWRHILATALFMPITAWFIEVLSRLWLKRRNTGLS